MSNASYDRMRALLENSGLSFSENGITNAEITAYSKAIDMVYEKLIETYYSIFINLEDSVNVDKYVEQLNLYTEDLTVNEIKKLIKERLGESYAQYTMGDFNKAIKKIGNSATYSWNEDWGIMFIDLVPEDLERLGRFIMSYTILRGNLTYYGHGWTFDQWDKFGQAFYKYDKLNLTFGILDTLGSEMIE